MSANLNTILEALTAGPGQGMGALTPQALLAQMAEDNPTVGLLTKYFSQRQEQAGKSETSAVEESDELSEYSTELERAGTRTVETAEAMRELRERIEKLYAELETLRERNDSLALALGACPLCWGEDVLCAICQGVGRPGFTMPDRAAFTPLVGPAVRMFLKRRNAQPPFSQGADMRR